MSHKEQEDCFCFFFTVKDKLPAFVMMMNYFAMTKSIRLYWRFSPTLISDMLQAGFENLQNLSSDFLK